MSSGQTALHSLPALPRASNAPLSLLLPSQTLRWFVMGALGIWTKSALFASACGQSSQRSVVPPLPTANAALVCGGSPGSLQRPLVLLSLQTNFVGLRWERRLQSELHTEVLLGIIGEIPMEIVTHPTVGMCYNSMTFQVLVNFTISFTGVTLASSR